MIIPLYLLLFLLVRIEWWVHVTVTPDLTSKMVFNSGTLIGLNVLIILGGHIWPISKFGLILEWKYDQKKLLKKKISEIMNKTIPILRPSITVFWWNPSFIDSFRTFFHHRTGDVIIKMIGSCIILEDFVVIIKTKFIITSHACKDLTNGHGFSDTMWNWWNLFIIVRIFHYDKVWLML